MEEPDHPVTVDLGKAEQTRVTGFMSFVLAPLRALHTDPVTLTRSPGGGSTVTG